MDNCSRKMMGLFFEKVWLDKSKYVEAECVFYENLAKAALTPLAGEVAKARQRLLEIKNGFQEVPLPRLPVTIEELSMFQIQFAEFGGYLKELRTQVAKLDVRMLSMEKRVKEIGIARDARHRKQLRHEKQKDFDIDVYISGSEEEELAAKAKDREEILAAYHATKATRPTLIQKSNVIFDVKPWDDETDMKVLEEELRKIKTEGLLWGASKLVPLAYGIHKLQISCVVEDSIVSVDWLQEQIENLEDHVQSIDIAAFNKV